MSAKGNLARGRQKTLVSGENIKTIYGKSILGSGDLEGQWKLLGEASIAEGESATDVIRINGLEESFFTKYKKFKLTFDLTSGSSSTYIGFRVMFHTTGSSNADYRVFAKTSPAIYRRDTSSHYIGEMLMFKDKNAENTLYSVLLPTQAGTAVDAAAIMVARNNNDFGTGATAATLKDVKIDIFNVNALAAGSIIKFYGSEE